jgi:hypothetical protein
MAKWRWRSALQVAENSIGLRGSAALWLGRRDFGSRRQHRCFCDHRRRPPSRSPHLIGVIAAATRGRFDPRAGVRKARGQTTAWDDYQPYPQLSAGFRNATDAVVTDIGT